MGIRRVSRVLRTVDRTATTSLLALAGLHLLLALTGLGSLRTRAERAGAPPRFAYVPDPARGYRLRANAQWTHRSESAGFAVAVRTDERGYRGSRREGPGGVLVVGDSFAFGWGVEEEDSFARVAQRALEDAAGTRIPFHVAACPGQDPTGHLEQAREALHAARPQVVLWSGFLGDDLLEPAESASSTVVGGYLVSIDVAALPAPERLSAATRVVATSRAPWWDGLRTAGASGAPVWIPAASEALAPEILVRAAAEERGAGDVARLRLLVALGSPADPWRDARRARYVRDARALHDLCRAATARLVALPIPPPALVDEDAWAARVGSLVRTDDVADRRAGWRAILDALRELEIEVIDVTDDVAAAARRGPVHFRGDGHWRPAVQRAIGARLAAVLQPHLVAGAGNARESSGRAWHLAESDEPRPGRLATRLRTLSEELRAVR